jgi:hypothetical protein
MFTVVLSAALNDSDPSAEAKATSWFSPVIP